MLKSKMRCRERIVRARNTLLMAIDGKNAIPFARPIKAEYMAAALDLLSWVLSAKETDFDRNLKAIEQSIRLGQTDAATPRKQSLAEAIARDHEWMRAHPMPMSPPRSSRRHGRNGHVKGGRA